MPFIACQHCKGSIEIGHGYSGNVVCRHCGQTFPVAAPARRSFIESLRPLGAVLAVIFAVILLIALNQSRPEPRNATSGVLEEIPEVLSAQVLSMEFETNRVAFEGKYKGKVVTVTGIVNEIGKLHNLVGTTTGFFIDLRTGEPGKFLRCAFKMEERGAVESLHRLDMVTVKGRDLREASLIGYLDMTHCVLAAQR